MKPLLLCLLILAAVAPPCYPLLLFFVPNFVDTFPVRYALGVGEFLPLGEHSRFREWFRARQPRGRLRKDRKRPMNR